MHAYINGLGNIAPQPVFNDGELLRDVSAYDTPCLYSIEPNYKDYIQPIQLRRMSRILKMGVTSAMHALQDAGIAVPDAIITATGIGMMEETEKFLNGLLDNGEKMLNPTAFIQSTHNTVGAHIAVMLKCNHYNFTYVHGPVSFESALLDGMMLLNEKPGSKILVGGVEEMTPEHFNVTDSVGFWKKGGIRNLDLLRYASPGTIAGEGAAFFVLSSQKTGHDYALLRDVTAFYRPSGKEDIMQHIRLFLKKNGLSLSEIDLMITGMNGDDRYDGIYHEIASAMPESNIAYYKHLCGEHYLASSFALWLASRIIHDRLLPAIIIVKSGKTFRKEPRNILLYNHHQGIHHSLMLVTPC